VERRLGRGGEGRGGEWKEGEEEEKGGREGGERGRSRTSLDLIIMI
jgi:hypothetical protein